MALVTESIIIGDLRKRLYEEAVGSSYCSLGSDEL